MNWESGDQMWCCPFCQERTIKVFHRPSFGSFKTSRGSGVSRTRSVRKEEETIVISESCSKCGKTKAEISKLL